MIDGSYPATLVIDIDKLIQYTKKNFVYRGTFSESDSVSDLKRKGRGMVRW
jgi:hypothetical protein